MKNTYVRVIPTIESIEKCKRLGFEESHIIALQGPFSVELNVALIKQYGIRHLITKESGTAGGFGEKIEAAEKCGISTYVIARPEEEGMPLSEVENLLVKGADFHLILAGAGMGDGDSLTEEVKEAVKNADAIFGAKRILESLGCAQNKEKYSLFRAEDVIDIILAHPEYKKNVILFSGTADSIVEPDHFLSI